MLPRVLESLKEEAGKQYKYGLYYIAELYLQQSEENPNLSPKTKRYHREVVKLFKKTWKGPIEVEDVTKRVYVAW